MPTPNAPEMEWQTRKLRIDPQLDAAGWPHAQAVQPQLHRPFRREEFPTAAGPADYTLHLNGDVLAVVEAKKLTLGPQSVLTQVERVRTAFRKAPSTSMVFEYHSSMRQTGRSPGSGMPGMS